MGLQHKLTTRRARESRSKILMKDWKLYEHSTCNDKDTKKVFV